MNSWGCQHFRFGWDKIVDKNSQSEYKQMVIQMLKVSTQPKRKFPKLGGKAVRSTAFPPNFGLLVCNVTLSR